MALGVIETRDTLHLLGPRYDVDGIGFVSRADGFFSARLHLGAGMGLFSLVLDSTVPGQWHLFFPGIMTCEDYEDPPLLSSDTVFACAELLGAPPAGAPLTVETGEGEPAALSLTVDRLRLRAAWEPFTFELSLEAGDARLWIDRRARWTLERPGQPPREDVRFATELRVWTKLT